MIEAFAPNGFNEPLDNAVLPWARGSRTEAFNISNTPQFAGPGTTFGTGQFGVITRQANNPRQIQFGLKLIW